MAPRIEIDKQRIADFCQRHHVRRLALFGSVLRDDFGPGSDVDVLVEFERGHAPASRSSTCRRSSARSWAAVSTCTRRAR